MPDILPAGARVCGYARDSGGRDQNLSVTQQKESIGKWCAEQGLVLSRIFEDIARSGTSTTGRDAFLEMVDYLSGTTVPERGLIIWEYARVARDFDDFMYFISDLRRRNYIVYSIADQVPEGLDGRLLESITAWKNARYSEDLRKNTRRGLHYVARTYRAWYGRPPIGYKKIAETIGKRRDGGAHTINHLVPDPASAPLVRRAFELRAQGATLAEIHNETHIFNWVVAYGRMLTNSIYLGYNQLGDEVIDSFCEPLIDTTTWQMADNVRKQRLTKYGYNHPRALRSRFWLTGLLHCAICDGPMFGSSRQQKHYKRYDYYKCAHYQNGKFNCDARNIPKDKIEGRVLDALRSLVLDKSILAKVTEEAQARLSVRDNAKKLSISAFGERLSNNEKQINRILAAIKEAGHSHTMLDELARLEKQQAELQQQLAQAEVQTSKPLFTVSLEDIIGKIQLSLDIVDDKKRAVIVRGFVTKVVAMSDKGVVAGKVYASLAGSAEIVLKLCYN